MTTSAVRASATRSKTACSVGGEQHLVDRRLGAELVARGHAVLGGPGAGPEGVQRLGDLAQPQRVEAAGRCHLEQLLQAPVQEGGPLPERGAALVGQEVHGHAPPLPFVAQHAIDRHDDVVEEDLGELGRAVHGLDGSHGDARRVHVDEERGDPPMGRLRRARAGEQHAPLGELGQARPHLLARDPPRVAVPDGPARQRPEVASPCPVRRSPGTRSRRPGAGGGPWWRPARAGRSRSSSGPGPPAWRTGPVPPGPGRSPPPAGRPAGASSRRGRRPARANPSA